MDNCIRLYNSDGSSVIQDVCSAQREPFDREINPSLTLLLSIVLDKASPETYGPILK